MNKFAIVTVIAGLTMAFTTLSSSAAIVRPRPGADAPEISAAECGLQLGHMRSVNRDDIDSIDGQHVMLIHVCDDRSLVDHDSYGLLFVDGNVNTLRQPIARNDTLMGALYDEGLDQNDVISLRFGGGDSIVLYVHDRAMN